jgi:hypothetical protein
MPMSSLLAIMIARSTRLHVILCCSDGTGSRDGADTGVEQGLAMNMLTGKLSDVPVTGSVARYYLCEYYPRK